MGNTCGVDQRTSEDKELMIITGANKSQHVAATTIQASFKGHKARKQYKSTQQDRLVTEDYQKVDENFNQLTQEASETLRMVGEFNFDEQKQFNSEEQAQSSKGFMQNQQDKSIYEGQWLKGYRHGSGKESLVDGGQFEGVFCNGERVSGRMIFANGDVYQGDYKNNHQSGSGSYTQYGGQSEYKGQWWEGKRHGHGTETFANGSSFVGKYQNDVKHGKGFYEWKDQSNFEGQLENDQFNGQGVFKWADGRKYEGEWRDNQMHGEGVFTWKEGKMYRGAYISNQKHGQGKFTWPDGTWFEGTWQDGKIHGEGTRFNGVKERQQTWENDRLVIDDGVEQKQE